MVEAEVKCAEDERNKRVASTCHGSIACNLPWASTGMGSCWSRLCCLFFDLRLPMEKKRLRKPMLV